MPSWVEQIAIQSPGVAVALYLVVTFLKHIKMEREAFSAVIQKLDERAAAREERMADALERSATAIGSANPRSG